MIVYDLECRAGGHRFEGWFGSSEDFDAQAERGLVTCPECSSGDIAKAVMAPAVGRKGNQARIAMPDADVAPGSGPGPAPGSASPSAPSTVPAAAQGASESETVSSRKLPAEAVKLMQKLATMQAEALKQSKWVGKDFAENARAIHYGERDDEIIHGEATAEEAQDLLEEGIEVAPLPFPIVPPDKAN